MNSSNKRCTLGGVGFVLVSAACGGMEEGAPGGPGSPAEGPGVAVAVDAFKPTPSLCPGLVDACFFVTNTDPGVVPGSLAQAIQDANGSALGGSRRTMILFDIPGAGEHVIEVNSPLPPIIGPGIVVNGLSQPGAAASTEGSAPTVQVILDGSIFGTHPVQPGIFVSGDSNVVKGLGVQNFSGAGILVRGSNNVIRDNRIGVDAAGFAQPNAGSGVDIREVTFANRVERNLIDGNAGHGVSVLRSEDTVIRENAIGATWDRQVGASKATASGATPTLASTSEMTESPPTTGVTRTRVPTPSSTRPSSPGSRSTQRAADMLWTSPWRVRGTSRTDTTLSSL